MDAQQQALLRQLEGKQERIHVLEMDVSSLKIELEQSEMRAIRENVVSSQLRLHLQATEAELLRSREENNLLNAVLRILKEDLNLKNEQFEYLFSHINAAHIEHERIRTKERESLLEHGFLSSSPLSPRQPSQSDSLSIEHSDSISKQAFAPPVEVLEQVFAFLDSVDLCKLSRTCTEWAMLTHQDFLWEPLYRLRYADKPRHMHNHGHSATDEGQATGADRFDSWKAQFGEWRRLERDWETGRPTITTLSGHTGTVTCLAHDANQRIISGSDDGSLRLWEMVRKSDLRVDPSEGIFHQHHRQKRGVTRMHAFHGHGGPVWCLSLCDGQLASGSYDKTIKLWNLNTGRCEKTLRGHSGWVSCLQLRNQRAVSGGWDAAIKVWDVESGRCLQSFQHAVGNAIHCMQWGTQTDHSKVTVGWRNSVVQVWDLESGEPVLTAVGHQKEVHCIQNDEDKIISGSGDSTVKLWDARTGLCQRTLKAHTSAVMCLQFEGHRLVTGSYDKTIRIWDLRLGEVIHTLEGHSAAVFCLQFDDCRLVSGSADKGVKIWSFCSQV
eukprot:GILK01006685.1.p1 GENE.GILK01006685.1~~GILK01006685.1.p1  ORF type:complete len:553 (+),score=72.49 GILK01006685.1:138-1796(+)